MPQHISLTMLGMLMLIILHLLKPQIQQKEVTIISQKWFALNGIAPFEVWSDYRRIDFSASTNHFIYGESVGYATGPAISIYPSNTKTEIPVRLLYPQSEYLYNPANVGAQPSAGAYPFAHVFWDLH